MNADISFYENLVNTNIQTILESGLLLDEDYEVLINTYEFKPATPMKTNNCLTNIPLGLVSAILPPIFSLFFAKNCRRTFITIVIPSLAVSFGILYWQYKKYRRKKKQTTIVSEVVKSLIKLRQLNIAVIRYMKTRAELGATKQIAFLNNTSVMGFIKNFTDKNKALFQNIRLHYTENDDEINAIDFEILLSTTTILESGFNEYTIKHLTKLQDIYTLTVSKFLGHLGVTLNNFTLSNNFNALQGVLETKLFNLLRIVESHTDNCLTEFNQLKYSSCKRMELVKPLEAGIGNKHNNISKNLQETLTSSINNLSIIMERSHAVLSNVEAMENATDFANSIKDLRNHAYATYESLDILCRLYGVLLKPKTDEGSSNITNITPSRDRQSNEINAMNIISFDDTETERRDENYELYIDNNTVIGDETGNAHNIDNDQSCKYLGLILRELRQSLAKHERFIEAKERRGSVDDTEKEVQIVQPPKFNLDILKTEHEEQKQVESPVSSSVPSPPPPPPRLPILNSEHGTGNCDSRSFLENIKLLSSQRQDKEKVFGDSGSSSDESN